jgi:DNA-directed RNA polymerase specialized sigma24 family protein
VSSRETLREEEGLTQLAFSRLLEWLDDGVDSQGETYLEMRRRLVMYFDRRNRLSADELADETLNRIGRTLEKTAISIRPPARYCYVVAKFVLLEDFRRERQHVALDESRSEASAIGARVARVDDGAVLTERRLECLDRCLDELRPEQRELVVDYYRDTRRQKIERRRDIAQRLGISMNALGIRACRIRSALETCVETCRKER